MAPFLLILLDADDHRDGELYEYDSLGEAIEKGSAALLHPDAPAAAFDVYQRCKRFERKVTALEVSPPAQVTVGPAINHD